MLTDADGGAGRNDLAGRVYEQRWVLGAVVEANLLVTEAVEVLVRANL